MYTHAFPTRLHRLGLSQSCRHSDVHRPATPCLLTRCTASTASLDSDDDVERLVRERLEASAPKPAFPPPPLLGDKSVRSSWNAVSVAFLGDAVFELYVRRHYFFPPARSQLYGDRVRAAVNAEAQDALYQRLIDTVGFLTDEERAVLRWGRNRAAGSSAPKRFSGSNSLAYCNASALETLVGWLYLTNPGRLQCVMDGVGLGGAGRPPTPL